MPKIFVSSVIKEAHVAVIEVNPYLIAKTIRAEVILDNVKKSAKRTNWKTTDEGEKTSEVYYSGNIGDENVKDLIEKVLPFIEELCTAFEGEDTKEE